MAGDWLKVEKLTPDKPEIRITAKRCNISNEIAFARWFKLWCWLDANVGEDGVFPLVTLLECSDHVNTPGFAESLADSGWLYETDSGLMIANWTRHNGNSAKKRAQGLNRTRKHRT